MEYDDFRKRTLKAEEKKHHFKVTNSYGNKEAWRWIKKNKWLDIGEPLTEREFGAIIKAINKHLQDQLLSVRMYLSLIEWGDLKLESLKLIGKSEKVN